MKYKKLLIFITSLIFITTLFFSSIFLFKIAEINVTTRKISGSNNYIDVLTTEYAKNYKGKNIIFTASENIKSDLENLSSYIKVNKIEKVFPNKLNIEVEERLEVFSLKYNEEYCVFDENLKLLSVKKENVNNINGLNNVELVLSLSDYNETLFASSKVLEFYDEQTQEMFDIIKSIVVERKDNIKSISVNVRSDGKINRFIVVTMTEGMEIQIDKSNERVKDKFDKLFEYYDSCDNKGDTLRRYVTLRDNGEIVVV